jgi:hypothetical protein
LIIHDSPSIQFVFKIYWRVFSLINRNSMCAEKLTIYFK